MTMPLTRGEFLRAASGGAAGLLFCSAEARAAVRRRSAGEIARGQPYMAFRSRPDLRPPTVSLIEHRAQSEEGYLFLGPTSKGGAQAGAMIVDSAGQLVWFHPVPNGSWVSNFRANQYEGAPVLTWWQGTVDQVIGYGRGHGVILDATYKQIGTVRAGNGRHADLHELLLTPQGTALISCYPEIVAADLSSIGGPTEGHVLESVIQEVDVRSGHLLFEWRSLDHIPISESYYPAIGVYDYLHVNSIDLTPDGHLLISARSTCALYKIHRRSGRVMWRLGGKHSDFAMGRGTRFAWQHDARICPGSRISLFDDGAGPLKTESESRGIVLEVDHRHRRVSLAQAYPHPPPVLAYAMGNVQLLGDGNVVVGWGNVPWLSEFTSDGSLLAELRLPWGHDSYRGFRLPWTGSPASAPVLAAAPAASGSSNLYASWNGATEVASWQVSTGPSPSQLSPATTVPRSGFETVIPLTAASGYASVTALGADGSALGTSNVVTL